jgi:hypothetical protein
MNRTTTALRPPNENRRLANRAAVQNEVPNEPPTTRRTIRDGEAGERGAAEANEAIASREEVEGANDRRAAMNDRSSRTSNQTRQVSSTVRSIKTRTAMISPTFANELKTIGVIGVETAAAGAAVPTAEVKIERDFAVKGRSTRELRSITAKSTIVISPSR